MSFSIRNLPPVLQQVLEIVLPAAAFSVSVIAAPTIRGDVKPNFGELLTVTVLLFLLSALMVPLVMTLLHIYSPTFMESEREHRVFVISQILALDNELEPIQLRINELGLTNPKEAQDLFRKFEWIAERYGVNFLPQATIADEYFGKRRGLKPVTYLEISSLGASLCADLAKIERELDVLEQFPEAVAA